MVAVREKEGEPCRQFQASFASHRAKTTVAPKTDGTQTRLAVVSHRRSDGFDHWRPLTVTGLLLFARSTSGAVVEERLNGFAYNLTAPRVTVPASSGLWRANKLPPGISVAPAAHVRGIP